jgi:hypothetical protein
MKPVNVTMPRVNIELGDLLYIAGLKQAFVVKTVRLNRRKLSSGAIAASTDGSWVELSPSGGWAKGELPNRIVRLQGLGILDTTGNGRVIDLKFGNESIFSLRNVQYVVIDTNTAGESGGENAIGQLRWGALPIDCWIWDDQTLKALCNSASGTVTFTIVFDVVEISVEQVTLAQVGQIAPSFATVVSRFGSARKSWQDFQALQNYL